MGFNTFIQVLSLFLWFVPSAAILFAQCAWSAIYRSYTSRHLYCYGSPKTSTEITFSGEKKPDLRKHKHLLESFGSVEATRSYNHPFSWLEPEQVPRNLPMWSVSRNVMNKWAAYLLGLQQKNSYFCRNCLLNTNSELQVQCTL